MKSIFLLIFLFIAPLMLSAQKTGTNLNIIGSAYMNNRSYDVLRRLCDEGGGRLAGSQQNEKALQILVSELESIGVKANLESFEMPGWFRGDDEVIMTEPTPRKLKAYALGYVDSEPQFSASCIYASYGLEENYDSINAKGKIVLVTQEAPKEKEQPLRYECIETAYKHGALAVLFINDKNGMLVIDGVTNFQGHKSAIPAFTITYEEGHWLQRLIEKGIPPKLTITVKSYCKPITTKNAVVTFPGKVKTKIVAGAHFDSWDLGQGGVDNGLGTAILYDVVRLIKENSADNYYTIELVWFNAEEFGLWGSKKYVEMHGNDDIAAMLNMDMTGSPTGFNVMGFDELKPFFNGLSSELGGFSLNEGVVSSPWTNSDHMYFMFEGIPTFTFLAHLEKDMYYYYHDSGDTFDKVSKRYLSDAAAIASVTLSELANIKDNIFRKRKKDEVKDLLLKFHLDKKLKRQGEWKFGD